MTPFEQLEQRVEEYGGTIQIAKALETGISKPVFGAYVKEKGLEQAAYGIYMCGGHSDAGAGNMVK